MEQIASAGAIDARRMFGEWAIYLDGKVVALVCDDQLFVKATADGRALIGQPTEAPPYPGAKASFRIDDLEDSDALVALLRTTARALPAPKPKRKPKREA